MQERIEEYGAVCFQNAVGTSVTRFLDFMLFYLSSTIIRKNKQFYVQKEGICIGSCIALILSNLPLACYNRQNLSALAKFNSVDEGISLC